MKRFLRQHVGLRYGVRYGLLVGLVGLLQIVAVAVLMVRARDAIVTLQLTEAASQRCYDQHVDPTTQQVAGAESCPPVSVTPEVYTLEHDIGIGYAVSLPPVFALYFLAGHAARRASGRGGSAAVSAFLAALVGGAIYILADLVRTLALFGPFVVRGPLAIMDLSPYHVGLVEEFVTLLILLAALSLCAPVLGVFGGEGASPPRTGTTEAD